MDKVKELVSLVDGFKTYIMLFIALVGLILWSNGVLTNDAFQIWASVSGIGVVAGFRSAIK